jgi:hypothetical protein
MPGVNDLPLSSRSLLAFAALPPAAGAEPHLAQQIQLAMETTRTVIAAAVGA